MKSSIGSTCSTSLADFVFANTVASIRSEPQTLSQREHLALPVFNYLDFSSSEKGLQKGYDWECAAARRQRFAQIQSPLCQLSRRTFCLVAIAAVENRKKAERPV